jgi:hypothetical protein
MPSKQPLSPIGQGGKRNKLVIVKAVILKLIERLVIDWLLFSIDRLEKKLEKKKELLQSKIPGDRLDNL